jgi:hypothetical protein
MSHVDELFGERGTPEPQVRRVAALVGGGLLLVVLGFGCSSIPGTLVVAAGWYTIEREIVRLDAGYYPELHRAQLSWWRSVAVGAMVASLVLLCVQGLLHCVGVYFGLWGMAIDAVLGALPEKALGT